MNCDPVDNELEEKNGWICKICWKEFGSGKALGGHMRVHKQEEAEEKKSCDDDDDGMKEYLNGLMKDGKPTCSLCDKSFRSMKSLFGHMRCHPEREWRGMQPPKGRVTTSSSSFPALDLLNCLPPWPVKARRCCGRGSTIKDDEIPEEAVDGLMTLAKGKSCYQCYHRLGSKRKCYPYSYSILEEEEDYDIAANVMQPPASSSSSTSLLLEGEGERAILGFDLNQLPNDHDIE